MLYESLLFEKEEDFHSTSHSSRRKNTPTLRVITLKSYRSKLYESLLPEKEEYFDSAGHCFRITLREGRILPLYASLLFEKEEYFHSTSH